MDIGWNYRREHLPLSQRSHYVITDGGAQPNVVPPTAAVWYYFRQTTFQGIKDLWAIGDKVAQGAAMIRIEDTGAGIPVEVQERIFQPFFTTKPIGQGTGLGLSICRGIVTALGGQISFESEPACGTTFRVVLPTTTGPV